MIRIVLCLAALAAASPLHAFPFWQRHASDRPVEADPDVDGTMPEDYLPGLKEIVDSASHQSPQLVAQALSIDIANAQKLYNGIAPMVFNVAGWSQYGDSVSHVADNSAANTTTRGLQYDFAGHQPVFHWGQLSDRLRQSQIGVAMSERRYATGYQQFIGGIRHQFLGLISDKLACRNAEYALGIRERALRAMEAQGKAGATSPAVLQGYQLDYDDAKLQVDQQEENYRFARRQLAREIGRADVADDAIPLEVPEPKYSATGANNLLADVLRTGARYLGDTQISLLQVKNSILEYDYWRVNLMPMFQIEGELNQQNATNATPSSVQQTAITQENLYFRADWNIFDGFGTRGRKEEALLTRRQTERELKLQVDQEMDLAQNAEHNVEFAWRALQTTSVRAAIAHADLLFAQQDQARGAGSEEAVAAARSNDYGYQYNLMTARALFLSTWADFVAATGHDPALNALPARYVRPVQ